MKNCGKDFIGKYLLSKKHLRPLVGGQCFQTPSVIHFYRQEFDVLFFPSELGEFRVRSDCRGFENGWIGTTFYPGEKVSDYTGVWNFLNHLMYKGSRSGSNFRVLIRREDLETAYPEYFITKNSGYSFDMVSTCNISMLANIKHIYEEEKNSKVLSFFSDIFADRKGKHTLAIITAIHGTTFSVPLERIYQVPQSKRKLML